MDHNKINQHVVKWLCIRWRNQYVELEEFILSVTNNGTADLGWNSGALLWRYVVIKIVI